MYIVYIYVYIVYKYINVYIIYVYDLCVCILSSELCAEYKIFISIFYFFSKTNKILCSKCTLIQMRKKFKKMQFITNRSFKIHDFSIKNATSILCKTRQTESGVVRNKIKYLMNSRKQVLFMKTVVAIFGGTFDCFRYFCLVFFCKKIKEKRLGNFIFWNVSLCIGKLFRKSCRQVTNQLVQSIVVCFKCHLLLSDDWYSAVYWIEICL